MLVCDRVGGHGQVELERAPYGGVGRKSDQISWARRELMHVSRMLERLARQEDAVTGPDVP